MCEYTSHLDNWINRQISICVKFPNASGHIMQQGKSLWVDAFEIGLLLCAVGTVTKRIINKKYIIYIELA